MMRELAISVEMCKEGQYENIFSRSHRESTTSKLNQEGKSTQAGKLWSKPGDLRNDFIHVGWREGGARPSARVMRKTKECLSLLEELFASDGVGCRFPCEQQPLTPKKEGKFVKVLVTPLGMSPGLLYTALLQINPDQVIVLTSAQGKEQLGAVLEKAAFKSAVEVIEVKDPFAAYDEVPRVKEFLANYLEQLPQCRLYINLTGGTTLLQHMISRLDEVSPENCSQVTTVAMVDRRSSDEQREDPYVVGEMIIAE